MGVLDDAIREHLELRRRHGASEDELKRQQDEALGPARREPVPAEQGGPPTARATEPATRAERPSPPGGRKQVPSPEDPEADEVPVEEALEPRRSAQAAEARPADDVGAQPTRVFDADELDEEELAEEELAEELAEGDDRAAYEDDTLYRPPPAAPLPGAEELDEEELAEEELADELAGEAVVESYADDTWAQEAPRVGDEPMVAPEEELDEAELAEEEEIAAEHLDRADTPPYGFEAHEESSPYRERPAEDEQDEDVPEDEQDEDVLEETPEFLQETPEHERLWFEQKPPRDFDLDR